MKGFLHPGYAAALSEFGTPLELPRCGGWVLERPIKDLQHRDAMGCYPLFLCRDWSRLPADLEDLRGEVIALSLVADPFAHEDPKLLASCFDRVVPFKEHFVADLSRPVDQVVTRHHRKYARRALRELQIEVCEEPIRFLDEWEAMYGCLAARFAITGIRAFSRSSFAAQLAVPGAVLFRALHHGTAVANHLLYSDDRYCYGHLAGISPAGEELLASYALYFCEVEYFAKKGVQWIDWGGGVGVSNEAGDGLSQFKRGWSTETRTAYFCGRIFDSKMYQEIVDASGVGATDFFPAYRNGEFS